MWRNSISRLKNCKSHHILPLSKLAMSTNSGPIAKSITEAIVDTFQPIHFEVINESYMHNVPKDAETHFKVLIVSNKFDSLPLIKRHRLVNTSVKEKLGDNFVHALSIVAKSSTEWDQSYKVEPSPNCKGGFGK